MIISTLSGGLPLEGECNPIIIGHANFERLIAIMLGVLRMDVDSCIEKYIDMAPKIFPVERMISGSRIARAFTALSGQQRFDPAPFEAIIKQLIADQLANRSQNGEDTTLRFEATNAKQCKVLV